MIFSTKALLLAVASVLSFVHVIGKLLDYGQLLGSWAAGVWLLCELSVTTAECECGYTLSTNETVALYTDAFESDFRSLKNITADTDWTIQQWNVSKELSKGPYGRVYKTRNVVSNPVLDAKDGVWGFGRNGTTAGLELWVRSGLVEDEYISGAEIDTIRRDMLYGTFRVGMQATAVNGTCAAFFW